MKSCPFCGRAIDDDMECCSECKKKIDDDAVTHNPITEAMLRYDEISDTELRRKHGLVKCPRCGEHDLHPLNETTTSVQTNGGGYSSSKGCLGWLLFGPIGLLFGEMGQKQKTTINTEQKLFWVCKECGFKFRNLDDWETEINMKLKQQKLKQYSAAVFGVLALLFILFGGGIRFLGILFFVIAVINSISALTLNQIVKHERKDFIRLQEESMD